MSEWTEEKDWRDGAFAAYDAITLSGNDYKRALACVRLCAGHADLAKCEIADLGERQSWLDDIRIMQEQIREQAAKITQQRTELATLRELLRVNGEANAEITRHNIELREQLSAKDKMLADCFKAAGDDPDGNEDWRIAPDALRAVQELRKDYDTACEQIASREAELAEARKNVVRYEYLKSDMNTGWICAMRRESKEWDEEIDAAIARQEGGT